MTDQNQIILQTKLHRQRLTGDLVFRPRLFESLDNGINCPLTLVCAPAGFGKTTLVSTWLEHMAAEPSFCGGIRHAGSMAFAG